MFAVVTHEWKDKIRVDFYFDPTDPYYEKHYVREPARPLTEKEISTLKNEDGGILKADFDAFVEKNIGWVWVNSPFNCHFMTVPKTLEDLDDAVKDRLATLRNSVTVDVAKASSDIKIPSSISKRTIIQAKYVDGLKQKSLIGVEVS